MYWKAQEQRYPNLTRMAVDILAIPISIVATESAFSIGGRVIDRFRSFLLPENGEALITTRDWDYEVDYLPCGRREFWKADTLVDHIKFDHGYTAKSPAIVNLLEIMGEFTSDQQHAFCQFVTGAPRLPPGGLAVLNPKLTIVRKLSQLLQIRHQTEMALQNQQTLPSVMTCANYLELPPYSTKAIMFKKLLYAISEGQESFDLS